MTVDWAWISIAALWFSLLIDRLVGEPPMRWHPVVWMGGYLAFTGRRIAPRAESRLGADFGRFGAGALAWCAGAVAFGAVALALQEWARQLPAWAAAIGLGVALKPMLSWRMLRSEVLSVESALGESLDAGRSKLSYVVSRDVTQLDESEVRESAIESLAENLNDSVVAPIFWFAVFGLPGAVIYRFANTADAMWGYHGVRSGRVWEWAGKFAARVDDVLSWAPARITAMLLALAALRWPRDLRQHARHTPSPNSGWPMAAMALLLDVRLGKPGFYALNPDGRAPTADDTRRAMRWGSRVVTIAGIVASAAVYAWARLAAP
ncbi:adenosylcobinamide-phosphate synthase CbiB [Variovorax sp. J22R133]|uniref:adenosylcobinamide-phosphate synthase CbiB n=1 Tax=Variovorax brevis TaxID=3053503 RepID=UPI002574ACCC|nr:adenosylcobinamide-phosphate synthase CbiB [Variovorax sp. J22R133]MDM0112531.1 adenosylcobinamide-phosphate synthase CbiB [Variovorax sp. J22R133]